MMEHMKRYHYAGVDINSADLSYDESEEKFIYKAFTALCNYAEDQLRCAGCPLSHICFPIKEIDSGKESSICLKEVN